MSHFADQIIMIGVLMCKQSFHEHIPVCRRTSAAVLLPPAVIRRLGDLNLSAHLRHLRLLPRSAFARRNFAMS